MPSDSDLERMSRSRLYVLVDAFERDIRRIMQRFVLTDLSEQAALGDLYNKAAQRQASDSAATDASNAADYLDLMEAYDVLNRHRRLLPEELATEVRQQTANMPRLVDARKRVMHPRPLLSDDPETVTLILLQFYSQWWQELHTVIALLRDDPMWEPMVDLRADQSLTLHNLPLPDYDETGLLGRDEEVRQISSLLKRRREPVLTITGEGGIGKTALALYVAYSLIDDLTRPFDAILWASMKHEKLTAEGVQEISGAVRDIAGSANELGRAFEATFSGSLFHLSEALRDIRTLVVLDNLETVSGAEFAIMYESLPDTVTYLVTSRIGIGQFERRFPLSELQDNAALRLLNEHIRYRRVRPLAKISADTRRTIVAKLRHSPLGIIWFVLAVEAGRNPIDLLKTQVELLEFCVRSVYEGLSDHARTVLHGLAVVRRPAGPDELVVVTGESIDLVNAGVQELERGSLVRRESGSTGADLRLVITLTETASAFLEGRVAIDPELRRSVASREAEFRKGEERRANEAASRSLAPAVIHARGPQDSAAAHLLRQAYLQAVAGVSERSTALLQEARRLDPDFWEVDRIEAFLKVYAGDYTGATTAYRAALAKAEGADKGIVAHFYAQHLSKNLRDSAQAAEYATLAHDLIESNETALGLGNIHIRNQAFEDGLELIKPLLATTTGKLRVIAMDSYVNGLRRWAEWIGREERNPAGQHQRASTGARIALDAIDAGMLDDKLRSTACRAAATAIQGATACLDQGLAPRGLDGWLDRLGASITRLANASEWPDVVRQIDLLAVRRPPISSARRLAKQLAEASADRSAWGDSDQSVLTGEVINLQAAYGFIRHPKFPANVFFHRDDCASLGAWSTLSIGVVVSFRTETTDRGVRGLEVQINDSAHGTQG